MLNQPLIGELTNEDAPSDEGAFLFPQNDSEDWEPDDDYFDWLITLCQMGEAP